MTRHDLAAAAVLAAILTLYAWVIPQSFQTSGGAPTVGQAGPGAPPTHTPTGQAYVWPGAASSPAAPPGHTLDVETSGGATPSDGGEGAHLSQGQQQTSPPQPERLDPTPASRTQRQVAVALHQADRRDEWPCLYAIYKAESGWNPTAKGDRHLGGSYGLPQRHAPVWGEPEQWPWPVPDQVAWTLTYIDDRYQGDACIAWDAWKSRADDNNIGGWW